jgi:DnaJ-class molecular chaperone
MLPIRFFLSCYFLLTHTATSFVVISETNVLHRPRLTSTHAAKKKTHSGNSEENFLLQEFAVASGEIINPYDILKVSRKSTRDEIRASYLKQTRRYHPDGYRHRSILPGSCNNIDDVRDQWERIKLSYEILSNPKTRKRYDRHEVLTNPSAAIQRAAMNAALDGVASFGRGVFGIGSMAVQAVVKRNDEKRQRKE